jgi:two-component system phosphate regulon sensor histidine kinase PhoR
VATTSWWKEFRKVAFYFLVVVGLGTAAGYGLEALAFAALLLVIYWLNQLRRVSDWMRRPDVEPPEARGLWGEFFDSIYRLQRHDREERDRLQTAVSYLRDSLAALKDAAVLIAPSANIEWSNSAAQELLGLQYPRDRGQAIVNLLRVPNFSAYFTGGDYQQPLLIESPLDANLQLQVEITAFGRGSRLMFCRDVTREQQLEKMRRDFVANVSHELRTPLTVISGYLLTLMDTDLGRETRLQQPMLQMQQQAERMETLLRDLLWLSQIESTEGREEFRPLDMRDMINEVREFALGAYPERVINTEILTEHRVDGNYKQLYSAVSNLVINALKYSTGDVGIQWSEGEGALCLAVTDRGPGIDAVHLPRLTERFYRVDKSRSQGTGGTGLGLAIVKHVLAGHNARLEIESEVGVGSTYRCLFPAPQEGETGVGETPGRATESESQN